LFNLLKNKNLKMKKLALITGIFLISILLISCGKQDGSDQTSSQINGAGATFPYPLYSKWFDEYSKINTEAKINYQSIGSGGGIKQVSEGTVDFGATDSPMTAEEQKSAETKNNSKIFHIPTVLGAVVLIYNLPGVDKPLNLSGTTVAEIYMGKIKKWNDAKIQADNEGVNLPDKEIVVIYRTDGSGTTYIFTDYLAKAHPEWKDAIGVSKTVKFATGQGAKGNEGVAGSVKQLPYSIGYVELIYALQNKLNYANIKNDAGEFVTPSLETVTNAGNAMLDQMGENLIVSITNAKGKDVYPVSSYTYLLVYEKNKNPNKAKTLKSFLIWALADGQKFAKELGYAPLPESVSKKTLEVINKIN
jgi:phosphate transport system substrate-binding protein